MPSASPSAAETSRNSLALVLHTLARAKQADIADAMRTSETTVSRLKTEHLESFCELLAHAGLKVVPIDADVYPRSRIDALLLLARERLQGAATAEDLRLGCLPPVV